MIKKLKYIDIKFMAHDSFPVWPSSCEAFRFHTEMENTISDLLFVVWRQVNNSSAWFIARTSVYNNEICKICLDIGVTIWMGAVYDKYIYIR